MVTVFNQYIYPQKAVLPEHPDQNAAASFTSSWSIRPYWPQALVGSSLQKNRPRYQT